jgi:RNA recognition motif-containing protein
MVRQKSGRIPEVRIMLKLFLTNIPHNCTEYELQQWIESHGIETTTIRVIRDLVAGVSPAFGYVDLKDLKQITAAVSMLNGKKIGDRTIHVQAARPPLSDRRTA